MGGARCTYRNCTSRSDGVTHMFHYPVFDRVRCHQWLTNAQRLEFLNLKVSQLKNRVVCQHHFTPDSFMNFKMDKLRYDAVPTENGPFCDVKDWPEEEVSKILPIVPEEIENDSLSHKEKKANFSTIYSDFLTNSEVVTSISDLEPTIKSDIVTQSKPYMEFKPSQGTIEIEVPPTNKSLSKMKTNRSDRVCIISEKKLPAPVKMKGKLEPVAPTFILRARKKKNEPTEEKSAQIEENIENMQVVFGLPPENTVNLTNSEFTLDPQMLVDSENLLLERPSVCLPPQEQNYNANQTYTQLKNLELSDFTDNSQAMLVNTPEKNNTNESNPLKAMDNQTTKTDYRSSPKSLIKSKIPPERIAAIEEKRKFNKNMIWGMIEYCLEEEDNLQKELSEKEKDRKANEPASGHTEKVVVSLQDIKKECRNRKVSSLLSKEPSLPSIEEYNMASIESRLNKMEIKLLQKIEQNSQKIMDLKNTLETAVVEKKTTMTQTKEDEESCKKQLYQEISKYLTPEANSLIYEELFLNKYLKKPLRKPVQNTSPPKRRKFS